MRPALLLSLAALPAFAQIDAAGALHQFHQACMSPDNQSLRVVAPQDADAPTGPGWTIRRSARTGDYEVVPTP